MASDHDAEDTGLDGSFHISVRYLLGLSWQIVPKRLLAPMNDPDAARAQRAMQPMLTVKRIDIAAVERAAEG